MKTERNKVYITTTFLISSWCTIDPNSFCYMILYSTVLICLYWTTHETFTVLMKTVHSYCENAINLTVNNHILTYLIRHYWSDIVRCLAVIMSPVFNYDYSVTMWFKVFSQWCTNKPLLSHLVHHSKDPWP